MWVCISIGLLRFSSLHVMCDGTVDYSALPGQEEPVLNGSTAVQSLPSTTRSRTLGWLDISLWTGGGRDKQPPPTSDSVEDFEYLEQQPASVSSLGRMDDRPDDTSSEEGGTLAAGAADESRTSTKSGTGVRANSTTRDPLSGGKRGKLGSSSSWQERSSTSAGRSVLPAGSAVIPSVVWYHRLSASKHTVEGYFSSALVPSVCITPARRCNVGVQTEILLDLQTLRPNFLR